MCILDHHETHKTLRIHLRVTPKHSETFLLGLLAGNTARRVQICGGTNCVMLLQLSQTALD